MAQYSIWVLEYAYVPKFHKSGVLYGAHNEGHVRLPYCYMVIKGNGHVAMVDVGYNNKDYGKESRRQLRRRELALAPRRCWPKSG